jgi:tRNA nucleotidyltransferase/poly(A) polymerase
MNALSVDRRGTIHDPLGGYPDLIAGRIRFIGEPDRRIAEDRLRILRFFRFDAQYGAGDIDHDGLSAAIHAREGLRDLSAERIGQEMRRLVVAPRAANTLAVMQDSGILEIVLAGIGYIAQFERLARFEDALGIAPEVPRRLAALACRITEDVDRVGDQLRLANLERERVRKAVGAAAAFASPLDERAARRVLYRLGAEAFQDGVMLAFALAGAEPDDARWQRLYRLPERWQAPRFPLRGRDVVAEGAQHGPAVGALLKSVEDWWVAEDFVPDETALRHRLQQMLAAAQ